MPRDKVEKLSISIPASQAAHIRMQIGADGLKGISEYFQRLVAEDIRKAKRRAVRTLKESERVQRGLKEAESGQFVVLDPNTIDLLVQTAVKRIMEAEGETKGNTSLRRSEKGAIRKIRKG